MTIWALLKKKRLWVALAIASSLIAIISHVPMSSLFDGIASAQSWLAGQGQWAVPTFMAIYILAAVFGLPNIILILAAGTLFGLTKGVISASIADTLSIAACFVIGQTIGRRWITKAVSENSRFHKLDQAFAQKGWKIVLLTRLSPVLPSNILNYGFSLSRINFWEYLFFSWLGMMPVIFTYVYIGTFGVNILTANRQADHLVFQAIGLAATLGVMVYATKLAASALKTEDPAKMPQPSAEKKTAEKIEEGVKESPQPSFSKTIKGVKSVKTFAKNTEQRPWRKLRRRTAKDDKLNNGLIAPGKKVTQHKISVNR
ncbi:MAG: TVP38/TMEM64 family protein [Phormidesmis sp.]